jgi:hypothetical protein
LTVRSLHAAVERFVRAQKIKLPLGNAIFILGLVDEPFNEHATAGSSQPTQPFHKVRVDTQTRSMGIG